MGQSYAWLSSENDLCLDSIEWDSNKVSKNVIKELMKKFSQAVYQVQTGIKHIHAGMGGQTPKGLFSRAIRNQKMKTGHQYSDSIEQYLISNQMPDNIREQMTEALKSYSTEFQNLMMHFIPFFPVEEMPFLINYMDIFALQIQSQKINYMMTQKSLKLSDFAPLTIEAYWKKSPEDQLEVTTLQKLMNAENAERLLDWMPTIPARDYDLIIESELPQKDSYLFQFLYCKNAHLLIDVFKKIHVNYRQKYLEMTPIFSVESFLCQLRNQQKFDLFIRLIALCPSDKQYHLIKENLNSPSLQHFFVSYHLDVIIEMLNMISDFNRLDFLKKMFQIQCTSRNFPLLMDYLTTSLPESLLVEFFKTQLIRLDHIPVWLFMSQIGEDLQVYLQGLSSEKQVEFLQTIDFFRVCVKYRAISSLRLMIAMLDQQQQYYFLVEKRYLWLMIMSKGMEEIVFEGFDAFHHQLLQVKQINQLFVELKRAYRLNVGNDFEQTLFDYQHERVEIDELLLAAQKLLQECLEHFQSPKSPQMKFFNSASQVEWVIQKLIFQQEQLFSSLEHHRTLTR